MCIRDRYVHGQRGALKTVPQPGVPTIILMADATVEQFKQVKADKRVVVTRDPRSFIISCADFHIDGPEIWWTREYTNKLIMAPSDEQRLLITLDTVGGVILRRIAEFIGIEDCHHVRLEDLTHDRSCKTYFELVDYLDYPTAERKLFLQSLIRNSLWSMKRRKQRWPLHVTSGVPHNFLDRFTPAVQERYDELFGDLHKQMGYE